MNKIFLIVIFQLINFIPCIINAQESEMNPGTSIRNDNFEFEFENKLSKKTKLKLDSIISDYNKLYSKGFYKSINIKSYYFNNEKTIFKQASRYTNKILDYLLTQGVQFTSLKIDFIPVDPNLSISSSKYKIYIFYEDWNYKYPEGTEPNWPCDFDEKDIKTKTQLDSFRKRCNKN